MVSNDECINPLIVCALQNCVNIMQLPNIPHTFYLKHSTMIAFDLIFKFKSYWSGGIYRTY